MAIQVQYIYIYVYVYKLPFLSIFDLCFKTKTKALERRLNRMLLMEHIQGIVLPFQHL